MAKKLKTAKSPILLSIIASVGVVATAVMAVNATLKFRDLEKEYPITEQEVRMKTIEYYAPVVAMGTGTILCIAGSAFISYKSQKALLGAYVMASNLYREYRKNTIEIGGEELDKEICEAMARSNCDYHCTALDTPDQKVLFYDSITGASKECYEREVMDAEYHLNRNYTLRGSAVVNEWCDFLGVPHVKKGDEEGWSMASGVYWLDFEHRLISRDDGGLPVYSIDCVWSPTKLEDWE